MTLSCQIKQETMTKEPTESIYIPIDLESSLGKIEMSDSTTDSMQIEPVARTSQNPFREIHSKNTHFIKPYPLSETDVEIKDRENLSQAVGSDWSLTGEPGYVKDSSDWPWLSDGADDAMSLPLEEVDTSMDEDIVLDKIEDPASFWDVSVPKATAEQPKGMSSTVSVASSS